MPHSYVVRVNYSFTKLNGKPFFGTYQAWYKYQSDTVDGIFPNQYGQIQGAIYLNPFFFPSAPDNIGRVEATRGKNLKVVGGKVVEFNGDADFGPLSINLSEKRFNFGYSAGGAGPNGEGTAICEDPVQV